MMPLLSFLKNSYWLYSAYFKQKTRAFFQNILYYYRMIKDITSLPQDFQTFILDQQNIIADQQKTIDQIREQYQQLQHQLHCLLRNRFGKKSEQGIPGQGYLFDPETTFPLNDQGTTPNDLTEEAVTNSSKKS